jgi:hypothetical protein
MTITRTAYLKNPGFESHHAYWAQAVTPSLIKRVVDRIGADRILKSEDKFFNDIGAAEQLKAPYVGHWVTRPGERATKQWRDCVAEHEACEFNTRTEAHTRPVSACSDSDRVCIAKAAARVWLQEQSA